jgi:hypothetical protein
MSQKKSEVRLPLSALLFSSDAALRRRRFQNHRAIYQFSGPDSATGRNDKPFSSK